MSKGSTKGGQDEEMIGTDGRLLMTVLSGLIGLAISFVLLELITRIVIDDGMNFDLEMWSYAKHIKVASPVDAIGHEHLPNRSKTLMGVPVSINSIGLRDREFDVTKPDNTVRILMLGDSLTFGWGVRLEDTPSKILEARLNSGDKPKNYEVINTGVGNYNTSQQVNYFLTKGKKLNPDVVVLNYFINDAEVTPRRKSGNLIENSYAVVFIMGRIDLFLRSYFGRGDWREYYLQLYTPAAPGWKVAQFELARLANFCRKNGIPLMVASYPELHQLVPYPFAEVTRKVEYLAMQNEVAFVDLLPSISGAEPRSLWVSPDDAHPNAKANAEFGKILERKLRSNFPNLF